MSDCPSIATIQKRVAERFGVRVLDLRSARRDRRTVWYRHVAMYLCRELTGHSLPNIGCHFGERDHTSVMYGIRRVADRMSRDPIDADLIGELSAALAGDVAGKRADGDREDILAKLTTLLERRKTLRAELEVLDRQIDQLGDLGWGTNESVVDNSLEGGQ